MQDYGAVSLWGEAAQHQPYQLLPSRMVVVHGFLPWPRILSHSEPRFPTVENGDEAGHLVQRSPRQPRGLRDTISPEIWGMQGYWLKRLGQDALFLPLDLEEMLRSVVH